jgi:transposase
VLSLTQAFVPIETEEQLDLQAVHRVRERWVRRRTAIVNQIRGLLLERGLTLPKGQWHVENTLHDILENAALNLSDSFRVLLAQLKVELGQLPPNRALCRQGGSVHRPNRLQ